VLSKGDIHNMQSSGSRGLELRTPDVEYCSHPWRVVFRVKMSICSPEIKHDPKGDNKENHGGLLVNLLT